MDQIDEPKLTVTNRIWLNIVVHIVRKRQNEVCPKTKQSANKRSKFSTHWNTFQFVSAISSQVLYSCPKYNGECHKPSGMTSNSMISKLFCFLLQVK